VGSVPFVPKFDNAWRPQAEIFEADPGHTVNGAEVDRFPMEVIEARKVSARHHHFPEKGPVIAENFVQRITADLGK
jgi:hypothetical protein